MPETHWPRFDVLNQHAEFWCVRSIVNHASGVSSTYRISVDLTEAQAREMAETLNLAREARELAEATLHMWVPGGDKRYAFACEEYVAAKAALEAKS